MVIIFDISFTTYLQLNILLWKNFQEITTSNSVIGFSAETNQLNWYKYFRDKHFADILGLKAILTLSGIEKWPDIL